MCGAGVRGSVLLTPTGHKVAASLYVDLSVTWCGVMYMQEIERETQVHCANYGPNLYGLHMGPGSQTMGSNMGRINCRLAVNFSPIDIRWA